jgi:hypothetical protein
MNIKINFILKKCQHNITTKNIAMKNIATKNIAMKNRFYLGFKKILDVKQIFVSTYYETELIDVGEIGRKAKNCS